MPPYHWYQWTEMYQKAKEAKNDNRYDNKSASTYDGALPSIMFPFIFLAQ